MSKSSGSVVVDRLRRVFRRIKVELLDAYGTASYSQEGEDMILRRIFENRRQGFYVDVGAHHPKRFSNTCYFYNLGWHGINIEPDTEGIKHFYRARRRDVNLCVGVSDNPGKMDYFVFDDPALNTFSQALAHEREKTTRYKIVQVRSVEVRRLDSIFRQYATNHQIDFLSIDTEGHEMSVLRSNDWVTYRPRCLLVEYLHASLLEATRSGVFEFVEALDYVLFAKTFNTLIFLDKSEDLVK